MVSSCWGPELLQVEPEVESLLLGGVWTCWWPARSLPDWVRNRMGAKSEAGWYTSLEGTRGAPRLVMYHRSVAAVTAVQCCMSGRRFDTSLSGLISREMHGPMRGVSRRMMCS